MAIKTLAATVRGDHLRTIELRWFFRTLALSPNLGAGVDAFEVLALLRKHGLRLSEPGGNLANADAVDAALAKVETDYRVLEEEDEAAPPEVNVWTTKRDSAMWSHPVAISEADSSMPKGSVFEGEEWYMVELSRGMDSLSVPVGSLLVKEEDYARVCRSLGLGGYYWPRVDWPQESRHLEKRSTSETPIGAASLPPCVENAVGFLPLKEAINLVVGAPEGFPMNAGHPGWLLWQAALSAKQRSWPVRECERTDGWRFVHVGDFLQWALEIETPLTVWPEGGIWTPERLQVEREGLEEWVRNKTISPAERDETTKRILWANDLLRRFAKAGVELRQDVSGGLVGDESDASLGAATRERLQEFANRNQERSHARKAEWERWQDKAAEIQAGRIRKVNSKRELARLVKAALNLPDSTETIRKQMPPTG